MKRPTFGNLLGSLCGTALAAALITSCAPRQNTLTEEEIAQATGAETLAEDDEDGEDDAAFTLQAVTDAIGKTPEKALLRMIYARLGDGKSEGYFRSYWNSYTMKHEENEKLDRIYALLVKLGYEMSDDEKALQDGTHELFGEATDE